MKNLSIRCLFTFILVLYSATGFSQSNESLPKGLTEVEKGLITDFQFRSSLITPPPGTPVRAAAEWEEVEYLVVTWNPNFQNILRQIVEVGVQECKVIITTQNETSVSAYLTNAGIDLTNITFLDADWDSIWIRDYAGNTIYANDVGARGLTDWIYNRPRPNDDVMPSAHANLTGIPLFTTNSGTNDLVNTGGNYMSDGLGNAFASELILEENEAGNPYGVSVKSEAQIDEIMFNYMGIENFIKMEKLPYDGIHHIDMHMKLLDEETLLVSRYPDGVADGPQIEENIEYVLSNFQSPFGTPYDIKWIDAPSSTSGSYPDTGGSYRTFSNSLILNKSILVPTYRPEVDAAALAYYEELMPGYNIVGIDVDNPGENLIQLLGALHCITHTIGVAEPLWIVHQPIDEALPDSDVEFNAMIKHTSGITDATLFWREEGAAEFIETPLSAGDEANYSTTLNFPGATNIEYYIAAEATSGKTVTRPFVAPEGFWTIEREILAVNDYAQHQISAPYPNPTENIVHFKLNQLGQDVSVRVHNILGQPLMQQLIPNANGVITLQLQPQWQGMLLVTFEGSFGKVFRKVLVL